MARLMQRSFTSGELAPALRSRADLSKFTTGLALSINMFCRAQGGNYSRPGFLFCGEVGDSTGIARVIPFSFNTDQTYILVFQNLTMRVVIDGEFVSASGGGVYELAVPYTSATLFRLSFIQDADTMTICHGDHEVAYITRTDHNDWQHAAVNFSSVVSAPVGVGAASTGTGHGSNNKTYSYVVTAVNENEIESLQSATASRTLGSLTQASAGVRVTWSAVAGAAYYRIYKDNNNNSGVFGWIGDSETTEFSDFNLAPLTDDTPLIDRNPLTGVNNRPHAVGNYMQRQIFANSISEPQTMFTTQIADNNSLRKSRHSKDTDAITLKISASQVNEIRHIIGSDDLILCTSGGMWRVTEKDDAFVPGAGARIQTHAGTSWVKPVVINESIVYVQEKGARLRDLNYTFEKNKYSGDDLSIMSEHLFEGHQIVERVYAEEPYGILWCVRDDGVLLGMTYQKEHKVWGWHQHVTDGLFESITSIKEGDRDAVYVVVRRTIDGVARRYVERMEPRETQNVVDCFYVDSGLIYDGTPTDTIPSGLEHLEGKAVAVLADGNVVNGITVASGGITIPYPASKIVIGLPYLPAMETLDIEQAGETVKPYSVSVSKVMLEIQDSRGVWVGGLNDDGGHSEMQEVGSRIDSDGYGTIGLKTGKVEVTIESHWSKGGGVRIEQQDPLPLAILSISPKVTIGG